MNLLLLKISKILDIYVLKNPFHHEIATDIDLWTEGVVGQIYCKCWTASIEQKFFCL